MRAKSGRKKKVVYHFLGKTSLMEAKSGSEKWLPLFFRENPQKVAATFSLDQGIGKVVSKCTKQPISVDILVNFEGGVAKSHRISILLFGALLAIICFTNDALLAAKLIMRES